MHDGLALDINNKSAAKMGDIVFLPACPCCKDDLFNHHERDDVVTKNKPEN
jgi:hypothetical protein